MPSETHESEVRDLLGESFAEEDVPKYPGRIYWYEGNFLTGFPHAPMLFVEVRFREAYASEDGDFTIYEARAIDTSSPEDSHGEWIRYTHTYADRDGDSE